MPWIDLPEDDATKELDKLTRHWRRDGGQVPNVVAIMKPTPKAFRTVLRMNDAVTFGGSRLGRRREELIATVVSAIDECFY
jgi:hypothetical protein